MMATDNTGFTPHLGAEPGDWLALLKPRVISLVVFTGAIGLFIAPGHINPVLGAVAIFCIALGAGAAGAINMWYDRDIDAMMRRTTDRPIPAGKIEASGALGYGIVLSVISVLLLAMATNLCAASVLALSIFYYAVIYTMWLKRRTPQNIVIGGGAGAFPAVIGWAAVTGNIGLLPMLLFAIVFFWTPPHFWSLAIRYREDYAAAHVPMLPVVATFKRTARQIVFYSVLLVACTLFFAVVGHMGIFYDVSAALLGAGFLLMAVRLQRQTSEKAAMAMFRYSITYLTLLFAAMAADVVIRHP